MPETPEQKKINDETDEMFSAPGATSLGGPQIAPPRTGWDAFLNALQSPGRSYVPQEGALVDTAAFTNPAAWGDAAKAGAQIAADAMGGGPLGAALSGAQALLFPDYTRPTVGYGNLISAATPGGPLTSRLIQAAKGTPALSPFITAMQKKAPSLLGAFAPEMVPQRMALRSRVPVNATMGASQAAADAADRGEPKGLPAVLGGTLGGAFAAGARSVQKNAERLQPVAATRINQILSETYPPPSNAPQLVDKFGEDIRLMSTIGHHTADAEQALSKAKLLQNQQTVLEKASAKKLPSVKALGTEVANHAAELNRLKADIELIGKADIDAAQDYLKYAGARQGRQLASLRENLTAELTELGNASQEMKSTSRWAAKVDRLAQRSEELSRTEAVHAENIANAQDLTGAQSRARAKRNISVLQSESVAGAADLRSKQLALDNAEGALNSLRSAAHGAQTGALKEGTAAVFFDTQSRDILKSLNIDPDKVTPDAHAFISSLKSENPGKLTIDQVLSSALSDETYSRGMRELLDQIDPNMKKAVQAKAVENIFARARNAPTKASKLGLFDRTYSTATSGNLAVDLVKEVSKLDPSTFNEFMGNKQAHSILLSLAKRAKDAQDFSSYRAMGLTGTPGMRVVRSGTEGTIALWAMGRLTQDPNVVVVLLGTAAADNFVINIPHMVQTLMESDRFGKSTSTAIKRFLETKRPAHLPQEVLKVASRFATPLAEYAVDLPVDEE